MGIARRWVRRFAILTDAQAAIIAAWLLAGWAVDAFEFGTYIHIGAPERGCGKSRLLDALAALARSAVKAGGTSAAALTRLLDRDTPTLFLDEMDALLGGNKELAEDIRGILNNGFQRGSPYWKVEGRDHKLRDFKVFGFKAFAGIGQVPVTIADRSIPITMRRKLPAEKVESRRGRDVKAEAEPILARLAEWASPATIEALRMARPQMPDALGDRQQDISEPLVAVADLAGGEWPETIRRALTEVFSARRGEDPSTGVQLLIDIRTCFAGQDRIASVDLAAALREMEGQPWADWANGRGLDAGKLARQLKRYDIAPRAIRTSAGTPRGYLREQFEDSWARYCGLMPEKGATAATAATTRINSGDSTSRQPATANPDPQQPQHRPEAVAGSRCNTASEPQHRNPHKQRVVAPVAAVAAPTDISKQGEMWEGVL